MTISRYTRLAVLLFPLLLPLYLVRFHIGPLPTTLLELSWLIILIAVTWQNGISIWKDGLDRIKTWHFPVIAWIAVTALAILIAPNHLAAFGLWRAYVIEPVLFFVILAATIKTTSDRELLIKSFVGVSVIVALWSIIQFVTGQGIPHPWDVDILHRRATGPFPFPNAVSLFCAPIAALCAGLLNRADKPTRNTRIWYIVGFVAATLATVLAKSVGGSLAIGIVTTLVLLKNQRSRWPTVIAGAIIGLVLWFTPPIHNIVVRTLTFNEWSGKVRTIIWKETWNMLKDHPIAGAGFGAYPEVIKPYHKATFIEIFQYPHNILFNFWSETGILGVLVFCWIVGIWIKSSIRARISPQDCAWTLLPLLAILIQGLVDVPYFKNDLAFAFWIFAAMTLRPSPPSSVSSNV